MKVNFILKKSCILLLVSSLFFSISISGCSQKPKTPAAAPRQIDPKTVTVAKAEITPIVVNVEYSSKLKPIQEINVSPEIAGKVASVNADIGMTVEKGQVLFTIDTADLQTQLKQQQANIDYYRANLTRTRDSSIEQQIFSAEQALNKAQVTYDDARANYEKNEALFRSGSLSRQALTDFETRLRNAEIDLNSARQNLNILKEKSAPQSVDVANAQLQQAEAGIDSVYTKLGNALVRSPITGTVSTRGISQGEIVSGSTRAFVVIDTSTLIAEVSLPDKIVEKLQKGQTAQLKINSQDKRAVEGVVDTISPSIDTGTQSYTVRIRVSNSDNSLKPGMFARVVLPAERKDNVLTVPNETIKIDSGIKYVYAVIDGKIKKTPVTVGLSNDKITEISGSIKSGDLIVTEGQIFLNDGERVKVAR